MAIRSNDPFDNSFLGTGNSLSEHEPGAGTTGGASERREPGSGAAGGRESSDHRDRLTLRGVRKRAKDFITGGEERKVKKRLDTPRRTANAGEYLEALAQTSLAENPLVKRVAQHVENRGYLQEPIDAVKKALAEAEPSVLVVKAASGDAKIHDGRRLYVPEDYDSFHDGEKLFALVDGAITIGRERDRLLTDVASLRDQYNMGIAFAQTLRLDAARFWPTKKNDPPYIAYLAVADRIEEQSRLNLDRI